MPDWEIKFDEMLDSYYGSLVECDLCSRLTKEVYELEGGIILACHSCADKSQEQRKSA